MSLRTRVAVLTILALVASLVALYCSLSGFIHDSIAKMDRDDAAHHVREVRAHVLRGLATLAEVGNEWSEQVAEELAESSGHPDRLAAALESSGVDTVVMLDEARQVVMARQYDQRKKKLVPIRPVVRDVARAAVPPSRKGGRVPSAQTLAAVDGRLALIVVRAVAEAEGSPVRSVVLARHVDSLPGSDGGERRLSLHLLDGRMPGDIRAVMGELASHDIVVRSNGRDGFSAYTALTDRTGRPVAVAKAEVQGLGERWRTAQIWLLVGLLALGLVTGALIRWAVRGVAREMEEGRTIERLHGAVVQQTTEGILLVECTDHSIISGNDALRSMLGYTGRDLSQQTLPGLLRGDKLHVEGLLGAIAAGERITACDVGLVRADGQLVDAEVSASFIDHAGRRVICVVVRDLSERRRADERIRYFAYHDALTGLPNRLLFQDRLTVALAHAERHDHPVGVMFIDLDRFKEVNDTMGHDAGDELLRQVAERLQTSVRASDTVARQGGDEFLVLLPGLRHPDETMLVGGRILELLRRPFDLGGREATISASIGLSLFPNDGKDAATLVKSADVAMYQAKGHGRDAFELYDTGMNERLSDHEAMRARLSLAVERDELLLHYQPQVDARTGGIASLEALLRWRSPELGLLSPSKFVAIAEETGLIVPIGAWVLKTVCRQIRAWKDAGVPVPRVSVNLSPRQLGHPGLVQAVREALLESGVDPAMLELEVTEAVPMKDPEGAHRVLTELRGLGVSLALDDFGTGFTSLAYLRRFPFQRVKMDREFLANLATSAEDQAVVEGMVRLAHGLSLGVVAEGIETTAHLELLTAFGCDLLQGYGLCRPMPAAESTELLRSGGSLFDPAAPAVHDDEKDREVG